MSNKINFTQKSIESLPAASPGKRSYYRDSKVFGLELMVTETGSKSFKVYRKIAGRPIRVTLGKFPTLTVENARKKAVGVNNKLNEGVNPNIEKKKANQEDSFKTAVENYIEKFSKYHNKGWKADKQSFDRHTSHWYSRKVSSFTADDISKLHNLLRDTSGVYAANRMLSRIKTIFNKSGRTGENNPAKGVTPFPMKSRERFIQPDEFPKFFKALGEELNSTAKDFIYLSLLTGARKTNVLTMKWKDVDLTSNKWRIEETKNGESITIPLVTEAVHILTARKQNCDLQIDKSDYVFPGTGRGGYLADPKKAWQRVLKKAEIKDLRLHDLRRSLGSYQAILGSNSFTIGKSLGHKSQASTAVYARLHLDPVKNSMQAAITEIMRLKGLTS